MKFLYIGILIPVQNISVIYLRVTTVINRKLNKMPATTIFRINGRPTSSCLYFINSYFMLRNISGNNFSWTEDWLISRPQYKIMHKKYTYDSRRTWTHHLTVRETKSQSLDFYFITSQHLLWAPLILPKLVSLYEVISLGRAPVFVRLSLTRSAVLAVTPCNMVRGSFEWKYCLHLQGKKRISLMRFFETCIIL